MERGDAAVAGELRVAVEAAEWSDLGEQLRGGDRAAAGECEQGWAVAAMRARSSWSSSRIVRVEAAAAADELARDLRVDLHAVWLAGEAARLFGLIPVGVEA